MSDRVIIAATAIASSFLAAAKGGIDEELGNGFAAKNPAILAGYLQTIAAVYHCERIDDALQDVAAALHDVASAIRESGSLDLCVTVHGLPRGLSEIAASITGAAKR